MYIVSYKVTIGHKVTTHFIRPEYTPNNREHAIRFETYEEAYEVANAVRSTLLSLGIHKVHFNFELL